MDVNRYDTQYMYMIVYDIWYMDMIVYDIRIMDVNMYGIQCMHIVVYDIGQIDYCDIQYMVLMSRISSCMNTQL